MRKFLPAQRRTRSRLLLLLLLLPPEEDEEHSWQAKPTNIKPRCEGRTAAWSDRIFKSAVAARLLGGLLLPARARVWRRAECAKGVKGVGR